MAGETAVQPVPFVNDPTAPEEQGPYQPPAPAAAAAAAAPAPTLDRGEGPVPAGMPAGMNRPTYPVQYGSMSETSPTPTVDAQLKSESWGSKVYHGILGALGGTQDTVMTGYDPKTGAPQYSTTQRGPGAQWKQIISGALTGLAAGSQVRGPGTAAFGAGFGAVEQRQDQQRQEQRQQAQQTFENQQKAAMTSAQTSMLTTQTAGLAYQNSRAQVNASVEDTERMNKFMTMISEGGAGTRYLNHFKTFEEAQAAFRNDPSLHDAHAQGQLVAMPHITDGKIDGVDAAYVTKDWANAMNDKDITFTTQKYENGKMTPVTFTIPKNSYSNDSVMKLMMGQAVDSMNQHWKEVSTVSEAGLRGAQAGEARAQTRKTNTDVDYMLEHGEYPGTGKGAGVIDPEDMPHVVAAIGQNRVSMQTLSRMLAKNPDLADEITKTYPDFREGMVKTFDKQQQEFTSGRIGGSLNSSGASIKHLNTLLSLNTPASHIPGTPAYRAYMTQARIASEELSKFYGGGTASVTGTEEHMKGLGGIGLGRDEAIRTAVGALGDKMAEYHQQWQNAMPSQYWTMPMPNISDTAEQQLAALDPTYAQAMKTWQPRGPATPTPAGQQPSQGNTGAAPQPQGNTRAAPQPQTHIWSKSLWQQAHPGQDVNAAAAAARAQNFQVAD